ncbi:MULTISPECIES: hypothetical protein [Methylobacterium]|nr:MULTISPECIES: hypothetical protein [Methylobacterium]
MRRDDGSASGGVGFLAREIPAVVPPIIAEILAEILAEIPA